jgi:chromosome segregation ATPase
VREGILPKVMEGDKTLFRRSDVEALKELDDEMKRQRGYFAAAVGDMQTLAVTENPRLEEENELLRAKVEELEAAMKATQGASKELVQANKSLQEQVEAAHLHVGAAHRDLNASRLFFDEAERQRHELTVQVAALNTSLQEHVNAAQRREEELAELKAARAWEPGLKEMLTHVKAKAASENIVAIHMTADGAHWTVRTERMVLTSSSEEL